MMLRSLQYFAMLFAAGFALGLIRVPLLEPNLGKRNAELIEAPIMLAVIYFVGRWMGTTRCGSISAGRTLGVGVIASSIVLLADLVVGVGLRGMTIYQVFFNRDPISGSVYYGLLAVAAIAPWWFRHQAKSLLSS